MWARIAGEFVGADCFALAVYDSYDSLSRMQSCYIGGKGALEGFHESSLLHFNVAGLLKGYGKGTARVIEVNTPHQCCGLCSSMYACVAWSYVDGTCYPMAELSKNHVIITDKKIVAQYHEFSKLPRNSKIKKTCSS